MDYKEGDLVVCIDASPGEIGVIEGYVYLVSAVFLCTDEPMVTLTDPSTLSVIGRFDYYEDPERFFARRFKKVG